MKSDGNVGFGNTVSEPTPVAELLVLQTNSLNQKNPEECSSGFFVSGLEKVPVNLATNYQTSVLQSALTNR